MRHPFDLQNEKIAKAHWKEVDKEINKEAREEEVAYGSFTNNKAGRKNGDHNKLNCKQILKEINNGTRGAVLNEIVDTISVDRLDVDLYYRKCLKCDSYFVARGRYNRRCGPCRYGVNKL